MAMVVATNPETWPDVLDNASTTNGYDESKDEGAYSAPSFLNPHL